MVNSREKKEELFSSYISGKSVALVGPAASIKNQNLGSLIDSYDIVARIKTFARDDTDDAGTRCDVLYTTSPHDRCDVIEKNTKKIHGHDSYVFEKYQNPIDVYSQRNIEWLVSSYPEDEWFTNRYKSDWESLEDKIKWRFCNSKPYFKAKQILSRDSPSRPNSGFASFLDLLSFNPEELFVCGLDFYRSLYVPSYQNGLATKDIIQLWTTPFDREAHHPDRQYAYFREVIKGTETSISLDPWFSKIIEDRDYDAMYDMKEGKKS